MFNPSNAVLAAAQAVGTILNDDGLSGEVDHFDLSEVPFPQYADSPFGLGVTARDSQGSIATNFAGSAFLIAIGAGQQTIVGTNAVGTWTYPLLASSHDMRLQTIYLAGEIGFTGRIHSLALDVVSVPGLTLSNWTIRLKHTAKTSFQTPAWESIGWNIVHHSDRTITATGWVEFPFTVPFDYDGVNNLMVDMTFNNSSSGVGGQCRYTSRAGNRSVFAQANSTFGDPLLWSGTNSPAAASTPRTPNLRLGVNPFLAVTPSTCGNFAGGLWIGSIRVLEAATNLVLRIDDGDGHVSITESGFDVLSAMDADLDGLIDAWETRYFGSITAPASSALDDPDQDGLNNLQEFHAATDPMDTTSTVKILSVDHNGTELRITLQSVRGRAYRLESTSELPGKPWTSVGSDTMGAGDLIHLFAPAPTADYPGFYRIRVLP